MVNLDFWVSMYVSVALICTEKKMYNFSLFCIFGLVDLIIINVC